MLEFNIRNKFFKRKKVEKKDSKSINKEKRSYQELYKTEKLYLSIIIVSRYQGEYYVERFIKEGCSLSFIIYGKGTAPSELLYVLGTPQSKKDVVISVVKESLKDKVNSIIDERFNFSKSAKGIAFMIDFDSVMGVLSYRYLSDTRVNERRDGSGK